MSSERKSSASGRSPRLTRFRMFLASFTAFVVVFPVVLEAFDIFARGTYVICSFFWFLVCTEVFVPSGRHGGWWHRIAWLKPVGWIAVAYVVFDRVAPVLLS